MDRGSRAEQAGFRAGDVIVKVNGAEVEDCSDFTRLLRDRKQGKASVTVMRDRKEQTLTLTLPEPRRTGSIRTAIMWRRRSARNLSTQDPKWRR